MEVVCILPSVAAFVSLLTISVSMAPRLKHLACNAETRVRSLSREDPLEKEMATHSSILAWRIPWREEPGSLQPMGSQSRTRLSDFTPSHTQRQAKNSPADAGDARDVGLIPG